MVAKFNGLPVKSSKTAASPTGKPVKQNAEKIVSPYSKAKSTGGTASIGTGGGNS